MARVELHNFTIKFLQLWDAGHNACLAVEFWAQPRRPGPFRLWNREQHADACKATANTADAPKANASKATDYKETRIAAANAAAPTEAYTFKKLLGNLRLLKKNLKLSRS